VRGKLAALLIPLLLVLCACGGAKENRETLLRQRYCDLTAFAAQAQVTADYGDYLYTYTVTLSGDLTGGSLTVLAPSSIAGTGFSWSEQEGTLTYEEVTLETGPLAQDGLSPVDAMPLMLRALTTGKLCSTGEQTLNGEDTVFLELANPAYGEGESAVLLWLGREDGGLRRGEITWEGTTVITYTFTDFTYSYSALAQETKG
jgi:hypothetical protein